MVYRSNNLYKSLSYISFLIAVLIVLVSFAFVTETSFRAAFITISLFVLVISFSYFNLSRQESKGDSN